MEELKEIGKDIKTISEKVQSIEIETKINSKSLTEHMRRTAANEKRIEKVEDRMFKGTLLQGGAVAALIAISELLRRLL